MFIDYLTLMLVNMAAGLVLLAAYVAFGLTRMDQRAWVPGFGIVGAVALCTGLHMSLTWPLPGVFNVAFGEMTVLLGVLFLAAAIALAKGWGLLSVGIYAAFAGAASIVVGVRLIDLALTMAPVPSGVGFILTGSAGALVLIAVLRPRWAVVRAVVALALLGAGALWAYTAFSAYWMHMASLQSWVPLPMRGA